MNKNLNVKYDTSAFRDLDLVGINEIISKFSRSEPRTLAESKEDLKALAKLLNRMCNNKDVDIVIKNLTKAGIFRESLKQWTDEEVSKIALDNKLTPKETARFRGILLSCLLDYYLAKDDFSSLYPDGFPMFSFVLHNFEVISILPQILNKRLELEKTNLFTEIDSIGVTQDKIEYIDQKIDYYSRLDMNNPIKLSTELITYLEKFRNRLITQPNQPQSISKKGTTLPHQIVLLKELGFFELEKFKHLTKTRMFEITAKLLNADIRGVKGNLAVLDPESEQNRTKFTSNNYTSEVKKYLENKN